MTYFIAFYLGDKGPRYDFGILFKYENGELKEIKTGIEVDKNPYEDVFFIIKYEEDLDTPVKTMFYTSMEPTIRDEWHEIYVIKAKMQAKIYEETLKDALDRLKQQYTQLPPHYIATIIHEDIPLLPAFTGHILLGYEVSLDKALNIAEEYEATTLWLIQEDENEDIYI